ncbi:MAG: hypothetical protein GY898_06715 [Proteobacteria bacterium]|nr:hypothetical protein [Pseudomonadota bacterium]
MAGHTVSHLANRRVIATDPKMLRSVAVGVLTVGRPFELLAFKFADNHLHALVFGDEATATEFGRRVEISISKRTRPGVRFAHVHVEAVQTQSHLRNAFRYVFRQESKHGTCIDPLFEASNLPDLLGMRTIGQWTAPHVKRRLPRVTREDLLGFLPVRLGGAPNLELLRQSAEVAAGIPHLGWRSCAGLEARVAAVRVADDWLGYRHAPKLLGLGQSTCRRLREYKPRTKMVRAVIAQLQLQSAWEALQAAQPENPI